jgi:membrane fusion protein, heavy metal efflux system
MVVPAAVAIGLQFVWAVPFIAPSAVAGPTAAATAPSATTLATAPAAEAPAPPARGSKAARQAVGCMIGPERVAEIGTPVTGVIDSLPVERGDAVRKGQVLAVLAQDVEQAGVRAARTRSSIDADIHAAEANLVLTRERHARMAGLVGEGFVARQAVDQALAERDVAAQKLAQARAMKKVQEQELGVVQAQLGQRTLRSPFDGVVAERYANPGERVEDKPLLRVAMVNPLRVELVMPATRWGSVKRGDEIGVLPELPAAASMLARVTHVDKILDPASNTFRVRLSLPNPQHKVPAGARCKVDVPGQDQPATPAAPPSAALRPAAAGASGGVSPVVLRPAALDRALPAPRLKFSI